MWVPAAEPVEGDQRVPLSTKDQRNIIVAPWKHAFDLSVDAHKQMGTESRRIAVERFDEQIVIDKYLAAIALLANSGKNH